MAERQAHVGQAGIAAAQHLVHRFAVAGGGYVQIHPQAVAVVHMPQRFRQAEAAVVAIGGIALQG